MRKLFTVATLAAALALNGCATLTNASTKRIALTSTPESAEVQVDGELRGTTPVQVMLGNHRNHEVIFRKEGHRDITCNIRAEVEVKYVLLDIAFTALGGVIVDAATGKWKSLDRDSCNMTLPAIGLQQQEASIAIAACEMITPTDRDVLISRCQTQVYDHYISEHRDRSPEITDAAFVGPRTIQFEIRFNSGFRHADDDPTVTIWVDAHSCDWMAAP